jgi:hypothetical protein
MLLRCENLEPPMSLVGQSLRFAICACFRSSFKSGAIADITILTLSANSRREQVQQKCADWLTAESVYSR